MPANVKLLSEKPKLYIKKKENKENKQTNKQTQEYWSYLVCTIMVLSVLLEFFLWNEEKSEKRREK